MEFLRLCRFATPVCGFVFAALSLCTASGAPGDLDPTFGSGGKVITAIGNGDGRAYGSALQSDGKIVAVGSCENQFNDDFAVIRYSANGTLDTTFGSGGKVSTAFGSSHDVAFGVAVQGDGRIVVVGRSHNGSNQDIAIARYLQNGGLDTTFGSGGRVTTAIGSSNDVANSVAVQSDGKIVVAGYVSIGGYNDFAVVRYNANGTLDSTFGVGGKVSTDFSSQSDSAYAVTLQSDGKILVAGIALNGVNDLAVARYDADGSLDSTFGIGGKVTTALGSGFDFASSIAVQGDGKIVVAGYTQNGANNDIALVRYQSNGTLDAAFGSGGKVVTPVGGGSEGRGLALQSNGKIVVVGSAYIDAASRDDIATVRYNANGTLDSTFGVGGKVTTGMGTVDEARSVLLQPDGKIVAVGVTSSGGTNNFALVRYAGDLPVPTATPGIVTEITTTSARLSGTVNPNGLSTTVYFETAAEAAAYVSAGNVAAEGGPLTGNAVQNVTGVKTGLKPHTSYRFRVNATSSAGAVLSSEGTFVTANSVPVANDKTVHPGKVDTTEAVFSVATDASDADGDGLTVAVLSYSGSGSAEVTDGVVNFTTGLLAGEETLRLQISDDFGGSEEVTITLKNAAPTAATDVVSGDYGTALPIAVLDNDTDADSDALTLVSFTQPANGTVSASGGDEAVLVYTPALNFSGSDTFTYTVSDERSEPVTGTVQIAVGLPANPMSTVAKIKGGTVPGAGVEESGIPEGAIWKSFGVPAINDAGQVAVLGKWRSPGGSGAAIFVDERLVAKTGGTVPGLTDVTFKSFKDPVINAAGRVAFVATVKGAGVTRSNDTVLLTDAFTGAIQVVAREGDAAPDSGGATLRSFYSVSLQGEEMQEAGLLFSASMATGTGAPSVSRVNDFGAWLLTPTLGDSPRKIVREGDPGFAAGETIKNFKLLNSLSASPAQGRGHYAADGIAFSVTLSSRRQAIVRYVDGALAAVTITDDLVGEALPGAKWRSFGLPATANGTLSAVRGVLQKGLGGVVGANGTGIFMSEDAAQSYAPVVRIGDAAFGVDNAIFSGIKDPLVSAESEIAFIGTIKGGDVVAGDNTGLWWRNAGGWQLVAREGTQAAETEEGGKWRNFASVVLPSGQRGPFFLASLYKSQGLITSANDLGVWAVTSSGDVRLLVREGAVVDGKIIKSFSTLKAISGSPGVRRSFNNAGQLVYRGYFKDGTQGIVKVQVP